MSRKFTGNLAVNLRRPTASRSEGLLEGAKNSSKMAIEIDFHRNLDYLKE